MREQTKERMKEQTEERMHECKNERTNRRKIEKERKKRYKTQTNAREWKTASQGVNTGGRPRIAPAWLIFFFLIRALTLAGFLSQWTVDNQSPPIHPAVHK